MSYGNGVALTDRYLFPGAWPFPAVAGPLATPLLLWWALRREKLTWREVGLGLGRALRGAALGTLGGLAMAGAALAVLHFPLVIPGPVTYGRVQAMETGDVVARALVTMPLDTVLPEEVAFRGVLLALFLRRFSVTPAVLFSSLVFVLWHPLVNYHTLTNTNLATSPVLLAVGLTGAHLGVLLGGVVFCVLQLWPGHLAAPVAAHWAVNAGILAGLALR